METTCRMREVQVSFKETLKELVESVPGASGAILADWEGEAVEQYCYFDEFEMKVIGAHKGIILSQLRELHARYPLGELQDIVITTEEQHHVIHTVGPDYVLVMTMKRAALPARAVQGLRRVAHLFAKEIY